MEKQPFESNLKKVFIVTGNNPVANDFTMILNRHDFLSEVVPTGEKALEKIWEQPPMILLLGLDLEGMNGLDVLRVVRQDNRSRNIPIIAFSEMPDQATILTVFNLGVDDYLSRPFHPEEVAARIRAVVNRRNPHNYREGDVLEKGKIQIDLALHRVICNGKEIRLTPKEYELLTLLMRKEGRVLSRSYLLEAVWNLSKNVSTRSIDMLVARLRKKLKSKGNNWIETVQGYGYRIPAK